MCEMGMARQVVLITNSEKLYAQMSSYRIKLVNRAAFVGFPDRSVRTL